MFDLATGLFFVTVFLAFAITMVWLDYHKGD